MADGRNRTPMAIETVTPRRRDALRRWAGRVAALLLGLTVALTLLLWAAGDLWWPATLLLFGPRWWLAAPALAVAAAAGAARSRYGVAAGVAALAVALVPFAGLTVSVAPVLGGGGGGAGGLRLVTLNADGKAVNKAAFEAFLEQTRPDVLLVQDAGSLGSRPSDLPAGWAVAGGDLSLRAASPHPVEFAEGFFRPEFGAGRGAARFRFETPRCGVVTATCVHLPTPRDGLAAALHAAPGAAGQLGRDSAVRADASGRVADWAAAAGDLLLAGDFNTPPESRLYRRDWAGYRNAFADAGTGFGFTMTTRRAAVRIDHVLLAAPWECRDCWVGPDVGSTHRPVVADLVLGGGP